MRIPYGRLWAVSIGIFFLTGTALLALERPEPVRIQIDWRYQELPTGMGTYELASGTWPLWKMGHVTKGDASPLREEIAGGVLRLRPGEKKRFALGYTNTTDQPLYFFAAPHHADPPEFSLGFKFKCLCINHAYKILPGQTWYRIVEFRLAPSYQGDHLTITHSLIGMTATRAEDFNRSMRDSMNPDQ